MFAATKMVEATPMFATAMLFALLWKTAIFDTAARWRCLAMKAIVSNGCPRRQLSTVVKAIGYRRRISLAAAAMAILGNGCPQRRQWLY